ncbi:MAG: DUF3800 domain-containing protein [Patescibacteria group bacterium]
MISYKILALDETGKASLNHLSKNFVLSGLIISEKFKPKLDIAIRKLKKKHFNSEELVLHCRDILRKKGPFAILRENPTEEIKFWSEFVVIANRDEISFAFAIVDKAKARKLGWNEIAILKRVYKKMLEEFVKKHLDGNIKGKIVVESDPSQDKYLLGAHNQLQSIGIPSEGITGLDYRNKITSLSLVNKSNLDVDVQMADILAIMADIVYAMKIGGKKKLTKIELMMKRLIDRKMASKTNPGIFEILV